MRKTFIAAGVILGLALGGAALAIFAGPGMQYSASNSHTGVEHGAIWSRDVAYATDWH